MRKVFVKALFAVMISSLLVGCAIAPKPLAPFTAYDLNPKVRSGDYRQKTDSFLTILDSSGSMAEAYKGESKFETGKNFVHRMNQTIPDLKLTGGLEKFGGTVNPWAEQTCLVYGMTGYSKKGFGEGLQKFTVPKGETPMANAINAANGYLKSAPGNIAVIVVSDGRSTDSDPVAAAKKLKSQYGDRVCIYTVTVGNDPGGVKNMEGIARVGQCGFSTNAASITSGSDMADFVEKVFLAKVMKRGAPPPPPKPAPAPAGPRDTDRDGVYDHLDKCPGTPLGARVDAKGCWILQNVLFDTDKSKIKPQYYWILDEALTVMNKNPWLKMELLGYTDSDATTGYNMGLSKRRSDAVINYLKEKGVSGERLTPRWFGEARPVSSNSTSEGKAKNRRVELKPIF